MVCFISDTLVEKTNFSLASGCQVELASVLRDKGVHHFFQLQNPIWYRPMQAPCVLLQSVSSYVCQHLLCVEDLDSLVSSSSLALTFLLPALPQTSLSSEGRDLMEDIHF